MYELALNHRGHAFDVGTAEHWGVREVAARGHLAVVLDEEGSPITVPINTTRRQFAARMGPSATTRKYRLDALDANRRPLDGVPPAYVTVMGTASERAPSEEWSAEERGGGAPQVAADDPDERVERAPTPAPARTAPPLMIEAPNGTWPALPMPSAFSGLEYLFGEMVRGNIRAMSILTSTVADLAAAFSGGTTKMIDAGAGLVRAADGAAMPRRTPTVEPRQSPTPPVPPIVVQVPAPEPRNAAPDDEGDDDMGKASDEADGGLDQFIGKLGKVVSAVSPAMPHLVNLVRGHAPVPGAVGAGVRNAAAVDAEPEVEVVQESPSPAVTVTPAMRSHMRLVQLELGEDGALFHRIVLSFDPEQRTALIAQLCGMDLDDAVAAATGLVARMKSLHRRAGTHRASYMRTETAPTETTSPAHDAAADDLDDDEAEQDAGAEDANGDGAADEADADEVDADADASEVSRPDGRDADANGERFNGASDTGVTDVADGAARMDNARARSSARENEPTVPDVRAHMLRVAQHLTAIEALRAQALLTAASDQERTVWMRRLLPLAPEAAAEVVRTELARRDRA